MAGSGLQNLAGSNSYAGGTNVTGGTLQLGNVNALGTGAVAANGGVLDLAGLSITVPSFSGASGVVTTSVAQPVTFTVSQTGSTAFGGTLQNGAGVLSLVFSGASSGLLRLYGANTYSGSTDILAGTLQLASNTALNTTGPLAINSGGLLDMNGFSAGVGALNGSGTVDNVAGYGTSVLTVGNGNASGSFSGTIQNSTPNGGPNGGMAVVKTGSGTQYLSGTGTYLGGTILNGGVLNFTALAVPLLSSTSVTFNGGTLQYAAGNTLDVSPFIAPIAAGQAALIDTNGNNVAFGTGLSGTGGLTKLGAGLLTLNGSNTYLGTTRVAGGTLQLGTSNPNALPGGAVTANNGFLDLNGNNPTIGILSSSPSAAGGIITNSSNTQATLTLNQTTATTFGGTLQDGSGGLNLTLNGSGMLTLTGTNTYSFATTINAGVLKAGAANVFAPHSDVVVTGGTLDASIGPQSINLLTMSGAGALNLTIGSVLTTNNLVVNNLFGGTLNLSGATASGEQLIAYAPNAYSGSFTTVDLNGIPDPSLASSLQYTATALELPAPRSAERRRGQPATATGPLVPGAPTPRRPMPATRRS